jgi:hypothetical protein
VRASFLYIALRTTLGSDVSFEVFEPQGVTSQKTPFFNSRLHPASCPLCTGGTFWEAKRSGREVNTHHQLMSMPRTRGSLHPLAHVCGVEPNSPITGPTLPFTFTSRNVL